MIIDEQYDLANEAFREGMISEEEYKKRRSFCVYVDMRRLRLRGGGRGAFIRAAKKYIDTHQGRTIKRLLQEKNMDDTPKFPSRTAAVIHLVSKYLRHHEKVTSPTV